MHSSIWRPATEAAATGAEAVLLEWLAAIRGIVIATPAALHDWARQNPAGFRAAFAAFAQIDPQLADTAAGWLLGAGVRPDDRVRWRGHPDHPCLAGLIAIGGRLTANDTEATISRDDQPLWPPPLQVAPLRQTAASPDEG